MLIWTNTHNRNRSSSKSPRDKMEATPTKNRSLNNLQKPSPHKNTQPESLYSPFDYSALRGSGMNEKQITKIHQCFHRYDTGNKGVLTLEEFGKLMAAGGYNLGLKTLREMFREIKPIRKSGISLTDLVEMLKIADGISQSDKDIEKVFKVYDKSNRGAFDFQEYLKVAQSVDQCRSQNQMRAAFAAMDKDRDGLVSLQQFQHAMRP